MSNHPPMIEDDMPGELADISWWMPNERITRSAFPLDRDLHERTVAVSSSIRRRSAA
jgi:hypothetical protein